MLVLDRKIREGLWIQGGIFIKVLSIGRQRVKLGIEAPDDIEIVREELRSTAEYADGERAQTPMADDQSA